MKILFFINGLAAGGKERRLVELMKGLKNNPDVNFELAIMSRNIHYKEVFDLGVKIHFLVRSSKKDLSIFRKLYALCRELKPDILHCWDSMTAIYAAPVCKLLRIKLLNGMVVETPVRQNIFNKYWLRAQLSFPFSDVVIGNSEAGLKAYRAPKRKSKCFYNGFNFDRITNIPLSNLKETIGHNSRFIIIMVGAFSDRKDYDCYLAAAEIICKKRDDVTFIAVGDGENLLRISNSIQEPFKDTIKLLGKKSNVESYIAISDICVLATNTKVHGEGISNSILEYMALGKPVVATRGGGTNEIVLDGTTGFLVNGSSAAELAKKIDTLLNDDSLRAKMGKAGEERIRLHFSIDKMIDNYLSLYTEMYRH